MPTVGLIAVILQAVGTVIAMGALASTWRKHGEGQPLVPVPAWARLRRRRRELTVGGASHAGFGSAEPGTGGTELFLTEDARDDAIMRILGNRESVIVGERLDRFREDVLTQVRALVDADRLARQADAALRRRMTDIAVGSIRAQMIGLILVGVGTVLSYFA
jgi:hypothetical protein